MNKPVSPADLVTPKVTTGGIIGSRKVYSAPDAAPDLRVPIREIVLDPSSGEPPVPVYDPSGPYTDDNMAIDVEHGLKRTRVEWVRERGGGGRAEWNGPHPTLPRKRGRDWREYAPPHAIRVGAQGHHHQGDDLRR